MLVHGLSTEVDIWGLSLLVCLIAVLMYRLACLRWLCGRMQAVRGRRNFAGLARRMPAGPLIWLGLGKVDPGSSPGLCARCNATGQVHA